MSTLANYKNLYIQTAKEYLENLAVGLNNLDKNLQDLEAIKNIHLSSHSLKSQSQVMSYTNMANLSEIIEKNSKSVLDGESTVNAEFKDILDKAIKELNLCIAKIEKDGVERDMAIVVQKLRSL